MMKYLIVGGAGFIGSELVRTILRADNEITIMDDFSYGKMENIKDIYNKTIVIKKDITDKADLSELIKSQDVIINLACVHYEDSIKDISKDMRVNISGPLNILECLRKHDKSYVHISTGSVFGSNPSYPTKETDKKLNGITSPYMISKLAGESYVQYYNKTYGLKTIVIRPFFVYGYGGWNVVSIFIKRAIQGQQLIIYGTGEQTRTPTYIKDFVEGVNLAIYKKCWGEDFNLAGIEEISIKNLAEKIIMKTGKGKIEYQKSRNGEVMRVNPSIEKAKNILGYSPKINLENGLDYTIKEYNKNIH